MSPWKQSISAVVLLCVLVGCSSEPEGQDIERRYQQLLEAIRTNDEGALYTLARPEFQLQMDGLAGRIFRVQRAAEEGLLTLGPEAVRESLALRKDGTAPRDGVELFREWIDLGALTMGPGLEAGLASVGVSQRGNYSVLRTVNEDSFGFQKGQDGLWYSMLPERGYALWSGRDQVLENLTRLEEPLGNTDGESQ